MSCFSKVYRSFGFQDKVDFTKPNLVEQTFGCDTLHVLVIPWIEISSVEDRVVKDGSVGSFWLLPL